jgi:ABC-2 type transport system ATP-binding protein
MISFSGVSFGYRHRLLLYDALDLTLSSGTIYGLLGPNGAGKSTLLRLMAGLLYPKRGTIRVNGQSPADRNPAFLEDVFLVPEEFYLPPVRIGQFAASNAPFYPRFDAGQFAAYLAEFGLTNGQKLNELSYGQKKKVLIGFGLATNTALLLMDEPTNGLDIPSKAQFRRLVAAGTDGIENRTVIISTHQIRDLDTLIDPVVILGNGTGASMTVALNAGIEEITARLWFGLVPTLTDVPGPVLHAERVVGGYAVVAENQTDQPSRADIERLFTAVQTQPDRIRQLFQSAKTLVS